MKKPSIVTVPNPILKKATAKVDVFDDKLKEIGEILKQTLRQNSSDGIGLAANQLGIDQSIFVTEYRDDEGKITIPLQFFVNPKIVEQSPEIESMEEGCLSIPNIFLPITRAKKIKVKAQDLNGKRIRLTANDLFARLIQHEINHLQGKVFTQIYKEELFNKFPDIKKLKIVFLGSGKFAEIICRGLILMDLNLSMVITETAKHAGRSQEIRKTPVSETAKRFSKFLFESDNIKNLKNEIAKLGPDLIIVADFGQIIPQEILDEAKIAAINIHPSLLPKFRGPTPIQSVILEGDKESGVTIIKMNDKIDEGKIISQATIKVLDDDNALSLEIRLANLGLNLLLQILSDLQKDNFVQIAQDEKLATKTYKFKKQDGEIDWKKSPAQIERQIRAFFPWPGSFTFVDGKRLIIHHAHLAKKRLILDIVQPEGKKPMLFSQYLKGYRGKKPDWFKKIML